MTHAAQPDRASDGEPAAAPGNRGDPEVTELLRAWHQGDDDAVDRLLPLVYGELHRLAHSAMRGESQGHTLQTTALVHEAYVRLVDADLEWEGSGHFLRVAARAMRRVLVDHARARKAQKRGGGAPILALDTLEQVVASTSPPDEVLALDDALDRLFALDERKGRIVELCYFGGLTYDEIADTLEVSPATVHRDLRLARAWLYNELRDDT
ncbi:MAG: sigma-70 family RNA polymerase sigma factor [Gemmatimonadota bacterium]